MDTLFQKHTLLGFLGDYLPKVELYLNPVGKENPSGSPLRHWVNFKEESTIIGLDWRQFC